MAPKVKLTYFEGKGLGEPIRYLLAYAGIEYEDKRVKQTDWPNVRPTTPFGKMPIYEEDGKVIDQSSAICRYLARKHNLVGGTEWEAVRIDSVVDNIADLKADLFKYAMNDDGDELKKAKIKKVLEKETLPFYLTKFDGMVKENGGHFVGGKLTWADLLFASLHDFLSFMLGKKSYIEGYSNLTALVEKVNNLPQIKAWIAKRPASDW